MNLLIILGCSEEEMKFELHLQIHFIWTNLAIEMSKKMSFVILLLDI